MRSGINACRKYIISMRNLWWRLKGSSGFDKEVTEKIQGVYEVTGAVKTPSLHISISLMQT